MYSLCIVMTSGTLRDELVQELQSQGIGYSTVPDAESLSRVSISSNPDAVLLDMVDSDSYDVTVVVQQCETLRIPLLVFLTPAAFSGWNFNLSVADIILWPAHSGEIGLRVHRALVRRTVFPEGETIRVGDIIINPHRYDVYVAGKKVLLTYKEYELLKVLTSSPGRVFTREVLLNQVWGYDYYGGTRTVDVHVRRLRSKLGDAEAFIETIWHVGYRMQTRDGSSP
jgi:DNA-binding response OmpR family regulator